MAELLKADNDVPCDKKHRNSLCGLLIMTFISIILMV